MAKNNIKLFLVFFILPFCVEAQENRFVVTFTDKSFSSYSLENPEEFLSPKAISRREKQGIALRDNDLPVSPAYIDSLNSLGIEVYYKSKWFNAVLIQTDSASLSNLEDASYIQAIEFVAPGAKLNSREVSGKYASSSSKPNGTQKASKKQDSPDDPVILDQNIMLGVPQMHQEGFRGEGMLIAVFDGGFSNVNTVEAFEPLFDEGRIKATWNFVANDDSVYQYNGHGTRALSCIGGFIPKEFIGTAPGADFVLCVTEDVVGEYRIEEYNWLFAAEFADSAGVDIINTSLGYNVFSDQEMDYSYEDFDGETTVITKASAIAASKGMVLVTSAGNEGDKPWRYVSAPADADSILSVGAVFKDDYRRVPFSSVGPTADGRLKPEVAALGYSVASVSTSGDVTPANGTSFSAPLVTGLVAGFWQANPQLNNVEVIERIKHSGHRATAPNNEVGYGVPNFSRAMEEVILGNDEAIESGATFKVYPNPVLSDELTIEISNHHSRQNIEIVLYNSAGRAFKKKTFASINSTGKIRLDISDMQPGVYVMNVITAKTSEAAKLVRF